MARRKSIGLSGTALLLGTTSLYLIYIGVKDIPFADGLRQIFQEGKIKGSEKTPYTPKEAERRAGQGGSFFEDIFNSGSSTSIPDNIIGPNDSGITQLKGAARKAYVYYRQQGNWTIYGWGLRPSGNSDHPRGKALDIMRPKSNEALEIIAFFERMNGAKYWIWNRQIANVEIGNWQRRKYSGPSPHTDHVHLSFY